LNNNPVRPLAALGALLLLSGCAQDGLTVGPETAALGKPGIMPGIPAGYECPLVPNGFDPAGSIYRIDKTNSYWRVKDYSKDDAVKAMAGVRRDVKIGNYELSDRQKSSAGLQYAMLKKALPGLSADASADFKKDVSVDIVVEDIMGEVIDDQAAEFILTRFKQDMAAGSIKPQAGSRYFLVRETVKAGAVSYGLKKADVAKLGGEAQLQELAKAKADVTFKDNDGAFKITQKFGPERLNVCAKSAEVVIETPRGGERKVELKTADETTVPVIKRVGE